MLTDRYEQDVPAFPASAVTCKCGANAGDTLQDAAPVVLDDTYHCRAEAAPLRLAASFTGCLRIAQGSGMGDPGAETTLDCLLRFMAENGRSATAVLCSSRGAGGHMTRFLLPDVAFAGDTLYRLIAVETEHLQRRMAERIAPAFAAGTQITLATGAQRAVEDLAPGDFILTRDAGPQPVLWGHQHTTGAEGHCAPVRLAAGTLNATGDLILSPQNRLLIYQRRDMLGARQAEVMVTAADLVNGTSIVPLSGGQVTVVQVGLAGHPVIYANGIAVESTGYDPWTRAVVPEALRAEIEQTMPAPDAAAAAWPAPDLAAFPRAARAGLLEMASAC